MAKRKPPKSKKLTPGQLRARKEAAARMRALNAQRRTEANVIANSAARSAKKAAAKLNRNNRRRAENVTQRRFDSSLDGGFF